MVFNVNRVKITLQIKLERSRNCSQELQNRPRSILLEPGSREVFTPHTAAKISTARLLLMEPRVVQACEADMKSSGRMGVAIPRGYI